MNHNFYEDVKTLKELLELYRSEFLIIEAYNAEGRVFPGPVNPTAEITKHARFAFVRLTAGRDDVPEIVPTDPINFLALLERTAGKMPEEVCEHSEDYSSVIWHGQRYTFNSTQALCIKLLWIEWEKGGLGLREKTIGEKIESENDNYRLSHTFRNHKALGEMIYAVGDGGYRLGKPAKKQ